MQAKACTPSHAPSSELYQVYHHQSPCDSKHNQQKIANEMTIRFELPSVFAPVWLLVALKDLLDMQHLNSLLVGLSFGRGAAVAVEF
jgi:hypothetical protein